MIALKSTLVLSLAWLITLAMRNRSAAMRHLVWNAALLSILVLPFLSFSLPTFRVPAPDTGLAFQSTVFAPGAPATASQVSIPVQSRPQPIPFPWQTVLISIWAMGTIAAVGRMIFAVPAVWRLRRTRVPSRNEELEKLVGINRPVDIVETAAGTMPMAFGILHPVIFLPEDSSRWTADRRRAVMLHELAHIRRGDAGAQLLARIALSVYWWNPLAWIAWHEFLREQERAADDLVLACGTRASDYADHLVAIARTMLIRPAPLSVAMARPSQLESRVTAILNSAINRQTPSAAGMFLTAFVAACVMLPLAAARPQADAIPTDVDATIRAAVSQRNSEILDSAAKAAEQAHKYDVARTLLESAVSIRGQVSGQQSTEYAIGLLKLGDLERERNNTDSAQDLYLRAVQILGNRPEAGEALKQLGVQALKTNPEQAFSYFERAKNANPALAGSSLMWMAIAREHQQKPEEAEALFRAALNQAEPNSSDAVITMKIFSGFLRARGSVDEAAELTTRANAAQTVTQRPQPSPDVHRIGNGVTPPAVLQKTDPEYTEEARAAKLSGTVALYVEIAPDGSARNIAVVRTLGLGLDEKAVDAVRQWRFKPGTKDNQPVTVMATIEVNFRLL